MFYNKWLVGNMYLHKSEKQNSRKGGGSVVVDSMLIVSPTVGFVIVLCIGVRNFMFFLVLQSS